MARLILSESSETDSAPPWHQWDEVSIAVLEPFRRGSRLSGGLDELEIKVLKSIRDKVDLGDLTKLTGVPAVTLGKTIATLQIKGYLSEDGSITPDGLEASKE